MDRANSRPGLLGLPANSTGTPSLTTIPRLVPKPSLAPERPILGPPKPRLDEPIAVSLEALVPAHHFYRHLEAKLDLSFVRDLTHQLSAERDRPTIDPVIFIKLQLVMFFEGIRSARKRIETARLRLAHCWYLGYTLDEDLLNRSSLNRIRQWLGIVIVQCDVSRYRGPRYVRQSPPIPI